MRGHMLEKDLFTKILNEDYHLKMIFCSFIRKTKSWHEGD